MPRYGQQLSFIGSGPNGGDLDWTRGFFTNLTAKGEGALGSMWGWGLHHYSWNVSRGATTDWDAGKGDALVYTTDEWYEMLAQANLMESLITEHWAVMGEIDRDHRVKLVVDEWGTWHKPGSEVHPSHHLGQQSTIRDALVAGLTLDTFHRHADKVAMANIAQLVNCLQSLFLTDGDRFITTPTYHVFEMYAPHAARRPCAPSSGLRPSPMTACGRRAPSSGWQDRRQSTTGHSRSPSSTRTSPTRATRRSRCGAGA